MAAILLLILKLAIWLVILVAIFVPFEHFFAVSSHRPLRKGIGTDVCYYFLNSLLPAAILSIPAAILGWTVHQILPGKMLAFMAALPLWPHALLVLVATDFGYYWGHRWSHQIPFLWKFHSVHHSAEELDFLVNTRAHPLDMVFSRTCALVPVYILGLGGPTAATGGSDTVLWVTLLGTVWGFFIHSNLKCRLGPLEWLITTPKFHHWHHTRSGPIDRNYSSTLPWVDRIFGTHILPKEWPESYGIDAEMPPALIDQLLYPLLDHEVPLETAPAESEERLVEVGDGHNPY